MGLIDSIGVVLAARSAFGILTRQGAMLQFALHLVRTRAVQPVLLTTMQR
jgi:hypothetical protein